MANFTTREDIANRALQRMKMSRIFSFDDQSANALETQFAYDKLRRSELRSSIWRFATRRAILRPLDTTTLQLVPVDWSATEIYGIGSIVRYAGLVYFSKVQNNLGNAPGDDFVNWRLYFGQMLVSAWDTTKTYWAGDLVYSPINDQYKVYLSLVSNNEDTPGEYPAWSATEIYEVGDTVGIGPLALFVDPGNLPVFADPGNLPVFVRGSILNYQSTEDLNVGNDPTADGTTKWVPLPITGQPDQRFGAKWLEIGAQLSSVVTAYPLTAGPVSQRQNQNAFPLPNGYLREAPQNPKAGHNPYLGGPAGPVAPDWLYEGNAIVSQDVQPIIYRFIADVEDVTQMDDMFCEALAAKIAAETGPTINGNLTRTDIRDIKADYSEITARAKLVNSIETGVIDPPEDDYILVRF